MDNDDDDNLIGLKAFIDMSIRFWLLRYRKEDLDDDNEGSGSGGGFGFWKNKTKAEVGVIEILSNANTIYI